MKVNQEWIIPLLVLNVYYYINLKPGQCVHACTPNERPPPPKKYQRKVVIILSRLGECYFPP